MRIDVYVNLNNNKVENASTTRSLLYAFIQMLDTDFSYIKTKTHTNEENKNSKEKVCLNNNNNKT